LVLRPVAGAAYGGLVAWGDFELAAYEWTGDFPDPSDFLLSFSSQADGLTNPSRYRNAELDQLTATARREPDPVRRAALWQRADALVRADWPWIWLGVPLAVAVRQ